MHLVWLATVAALGASVPRCHGEPEGCIPRTDIAKWTVDEYARRDFGRWAVGHPDRTCPHGLIEVLRHIGKGPEDLLDPWGNVYQLRCDGHGIAVRSYGPDGEPDTADDIVAP